MRWTGPGRPREGGCEGFVKDLRNSFGSVDGAGVFADRRGQGDLIEVLEVTETDRFGGAAPGDEEHGGAVEVGVEDAGEGVGVRHAAADGAYADPAAETSGDFGHVPRGLFVADIHKPHPGIPAGGVQRVHPVTAEGGDK